MNVLKAVSTALIGLALALSGISLIASNDHSRSSAQSVSVSPAMGPAGPSGTVTQQASLTTIAAGTVTWTYPVAYAGGVVPITECLAVATVSTTYTVNCQLDGVPTNTQAKFRVTRADVTTVALLGLNILSIPSTPGITVIHVTARAP